MTAFVAEKPPLIRLDSGEWLDLLAPDWRLINLDEVAHRLAGLYRFAGRRDKSGRRISVAEHSLYVAYLTGKASTHPFFMRAALLHDAHEFAIGDFMRPVSRAIETLLPGFKNAANRLRYILDIPIARACFQRFDPGNAPDGYDEAARELAGCMRERPVKRADDMASHIEHEALTGQEPWPEQLLHLEPDIAAKMWLNALEGAFGAGA